MSINKGNNKVPLVALSSRRKYGEKTSHKQSTSFQYNATNSEVNYSKKSSTKHNYNTRKNKEEITKNMEFEDSEDYGNREYTKNVVNALKEAINENTKLINENFFLKEDILNLRKENNQKESALLELYNYYEFCKKNHTNCCETNSLNTKHLRSKYKKTDSSDSY